jgi:class 3 adenylate cyclase
MAQGGGAGGLIGRAPEMEVADGLLRAALVGRPGVLVLSGQAGMGKSTLAREVAARAARSGALELWGAGQEDVAIPYLPFAMAFEALRQGPHPVVLPLDDDPATSWTGAGEGLVRATAAQPLVLIIDDLQWADPSTQALLLHLLVVMEHAAHTQPVRCLTIVTLRTPIDDERTSRTLARMVREPGVEVVAVGGLDRTGVSDLVTASAGIRANAALVSRIAEATDGNPLLVQSLLRRGLAEGRIVERDGALALRDATDHLALDPSELDRSVVERLDRLSPQTLELLTTAALLGDEQPIDDLVDLAGLEASTADVLLDEAIAAGLLVERGQRCAFAFPQVRHVLFHRPSQRTRRRLHAAIARRLQERLGEAGALTISHHVARAAGQVPAEEVVHWCRAAAQAARAKGAWPEATVAAEHALEAMTPEPWEDRADLHILATETTYRDYDSGGALRHGEAAIALAEAHGDAIRWGRAVVPLARAMVTTSGDPSLVRTATDPSPHLRRFLRENPTAPIELRIEVLALLSEIHGANNRAEEASATAAEARALVTPDTAPALRGLVAVAEGMSSWARLDLRDTLAAYEEAADAVDLDFLDRAGLYARVRSDMVRYYLGDLDGATAGCLAMMERLEPALVWGEYAISAATVATASLVRGRFDLVEQHAELVDRAARRTTYVQSRPMAITALALGRVLRGDGRGAHAAIEHALWNPGMTARYHMAIDGLLGDLGRLRSAVEERPWRPPPHEATLATLPQIALHAEVASLIGNGTMALDARVPLLDAHERGVRFTAGWASSVARLIGDTFAASGDLDDARRWLAIAAEETAASAAPVEQARVRLSQARLAHLHPDVSAADTAALVAEAVAALDAVGLLPLVAAARRLSSTDDLPGPATRTILFTDLVESTALNVRVGDQVFLELVREHNDVVRGCLRRSSGVEFKHTGDGVAAWFASPVDAVECALAIGDELDRASQAHPDQPLLVRCGLSSGDPLGNEGDLFGLSVVQAARLCAAAVAGEVLVGPEVAAAARAHGAVFRSKGQMLLKGFPDALDVYVAVMTDAATTAR